MFLYHYLLFVIHSYFVLLIVPPVRLVCYILLDDVVFFFVFAWVCTCYGNISGGRNIGFACLVKLELLMQLLIRIIRIIINEINIIIN